MIRIANNGTTNKNAVSLPISENVKDFLQNFVLQSTSWFRVRMHHMYKTPFTKLSVRSANRLHRSCRSCRSHRSRRSQSRCPATRRDMNITCDKPRPTRSTPATTRRVVPATAMNINYTTHVHYTHVILLSFSSASVHI